MNRHNKPFLLACALATATFAAGQTAIDRPPTDIEGPIRLAETLSPPFRSWFLLRLALRPKSRPWRTTLITRAFDAATLAPSVPNLFIGKPGPFPQFVLPKDIGDLDGLRVQLQAIDALSNSDRDAAVALLERIVPPELPTDSCDTTLVRDPTRDYQLMQSLTKRLFAHGEDGDRRRQQYLVTVASHVTSSLQLPGLLLLLGDPAVTGTDLASNAGMFATALRRVEDGDPHYTAVMVTQDLSRQIVAFTQRLQNNQISPVPILTGYREYLLRNSVRRCTALLFHDRSLRQLPDRSPIETFNSLLDSLEVAGTLAGHELPKIPASTPQRQTAPSQPSPKADTMFSSAAGRKVSVEFAAFHNRAAALGAERTAAATDALDAEAKAVLTSAEEYFKHVTDSDEPKGRALAEAGHITQRIVELTDAVAIHQRAGTLLALVSSRHWEQDAGTRSYVYAYLKQFAGGCAQPNDAERATRLREARLAGMRSGTRGAAPELARLVELFATPWFC